MYRDETEAARLEGREAYLTGDHIDANPYLRGAAMRAWNEGFKAAAHPFDHFPHEGVFCAAQ